MSKSKMPEADESDEDIFHKIARKNTPPHIKIDYFEYPSEAGITDCCTGDIRVPEPDSLKTLRTYLHECGHSVLHRNDKTTPHHLREFKAESWALDKMRLGGLVLSNEFEAESKKQIANDILCDVHNKIRQVDREAFEFARPYFDEYRLAEVLPLVA